MELWTEGATLRVSGQVDVRTIAELRDALYGLLEAHPGDVVLDLTDVESADLTSLRMIAVASRLATREGRTLLVQGCPPLVRRLLHLSHLRGLVAVGDTAAAPAH
ncbi:MAG TPA: STAS domain-containing protein [Marmoricola sp.]|nr:STAS domain-containing protein [Marmoricola sp.]